MATVNAGKFLAQSQITSTRDSYENKTEKHIRPAFTWTSQEENKPKRLLRMCDINKPMVEA